MLFKKGYTVSVFVFIALLTGCSEPSSSQESSLSQAELAKEHQNHPEWPMEIREEVYGDADTFSTPRLMFWNKYKYSEVRTLWSSKLDGSDRRRIIPEEIFTQLEPAGLHPPARSPDNRYIAISGYINDRATRQLYDTKEKKLITMSAGGGVPHFNWTSDSENVIFYANGEHYNYSVSTSTLTKRKTIYSLGLFLLPGDKEFLAVRHDGFWIHKFNGEIVRKVNFGFPREWEMKNHRISPDGKYLAFMTHGRDDFHFHWVNLANPEIEHSEKGTGGGVIFSLDEDVTLKFGYNPRGEVDENNKPVTYSIITQTNILTGEQQVIRTKEMRMWGLRSIAPIAITNQKAQSN